MPSFILIHPTVWPQYTNVTERQDRQGSDSIGQTILQAVAQCGDVQQVHALCSAGAALHIDSRVTVIDKYQTGVLSNASDSPTDAISD